MNIYRELIAELTRKITYLDLDQAFVNAIAVLADGRSETAPECLSSLYIGHYEEGDCELLVESDFSPHNERWGAATTVIPVQLKSGNMLSLLLNIELSAQVFSNFALLIEVFCNQYEHLERAYKDGLTALKNRRAFDEEYARLAFKADKREIYFLAVLDIDFFKCVNDEYGHLVGDETLIAIANIMKEFFHKMNLLYRFGGEEFIALIKAHDCEGAAQRLNELREIIARYEFSQVGQKTVSIGFVAFDVAVDSSLLFEQADAALYYAKESGRNRVESYKYLVDKGLLESLAVHEGDVELF